MTVKVFVHNHYTEQTRTFEGETEAEVEQKLLERHDYARKRVRPGDLAMLVEYLNMQQSFDAWIERQEPKS